MTIDDSLFAKHCVNTGDLGFSDVFIVPQYTEITSRSQVDTSVQIGDIKIDIPVISANMDTVTDGLMAYAMAEGGAIGAIHRFMNHDDNVREFQVGTGDIHYQYSYPCFVSIGVNEESRIRAKRLYDAGARYFVIDIAHGHSLMMKEQLQWLRATYPDVYIMAGNVATAGAVHSLSAWGADGIKIGIGPGGVCVTKNITGVTVPQFSAILECAAACKTIQGKKPLIVADGGITEIGDIAKALGAGADLVMCGRLFAACREAPGERVNGKKVYRGMASRDAMLKIRSSDSMPTPEGISILVDTLEQSTIEVLKNIKGGLQSSFSYSNASTLKEFRAKVKFGVRHTAMK